MQLTKNFSRDELACPCCDRCEVEPAAVEKLQLLRDAVGRPMGINSGFRCEAHNESVGGYRKSRHMLGDGFDCSTVGWSSEELYNLVRQAQTLGFFGIGIARSYVHVDARPGRRKMWVY